MSQDTDEQKATIRCLNNGPYQIKNLERLKGIQGEEIPVKKAMALCRCGQSNNKPFCDGSHVAAKFSDKKLTDGKWNFRTSYQGKKIVIHDNRGICSHAGFCTDNLSKVFKMGVEPWINPDAEDVEQIIETIGKCPSGALSYSIDDREIRDQDRETAIKVTPNGPYWIQGGVELLDVEKGEDASDEHFCLCRCGTSKNKPFCDGSHWDAHFRDDTRYRLIQASLLKEREPTYAKAGKIDLVIIKNNSKISVLYGKCLHQGALLSDGEMKGDHLVCGLHGWTYDAETGVKIGDKNTCLHKFEHWVEQDELLVDLKEIEAFAQAESGSVNNDAKNTEEEPYVEYIHHLAVHGLEKTGSHGLMTAMGVPRRKLPSWDDLQILTAQLHRLPLLDDEPVDTSLILGPKAKKPLKMKLPIFVTDMSFGSLSFEAKLALAKGAELAGTGICSGEGGMLPEEQEANSRYLYELASAKFGFSMERLTRVQAFHFKGGQAAKTGTGGHLPAAKVTAKIASVRGLAEGQDAVSPARFLDLVEIEDFKRFADEVRETTGGIPIGFKLSAQQIEKDIEAALKIGVDYIILDGRGGGTGAAPLIFRDNIAVPTMAAIARARKYLNEHGNKEITLIATGGLRTAEDFVKAMALGADGIAIGNSALQAIGCIGTRACNTNNCPTGVATQKEHLRKLIQVDEAARKLERFLTASTHLMKILARACGYDRLDRFAIEDLTTCKREIAYLTGVPFAGVVPLRDDS